jgi:capsular polysaccharide biosynthesis protein
MTKLLQELTYKYPKPANFNPNDPSFEVFKDITNFEFFKPEIEILKNVRISTNSVIFTYFKIFKESCIGTPNYEQYKKGFRFFLKFIFPKLNFSKKRFILITDEWTSNYYHWHIFALRKLLILQEQNLIKDSLLLLPKKYQKYPFVAPCLKKFGVKPEQIVFLPKKSNIKVAEVPLIKQPRQDPPMFNKIREILLSNIPAKDFGFGDKIYISREKQALRFVENEEELVSTLEKWGFKKIIAEDFSYDEQLAIFSKAKYLVAPHGAGITNVLFMKEGGALLEMTTPQTPELFNKDFYSLSTMIGVKYFYQQCKIGKKSKVSDHHHGSLIVDLEKLEENLKLIIQCQIS